MTVLGPSGSGKSTALRLIAGLDQPDAGQIHIAGSDVTRLEPRERGVGMVFQSFALFPHMTVADNVGFGLAARKTASAEVKRRVAESAGMLGLERLLNRHPHELSGGERQRVALARALAGRPRLLLMDEPLSNLDAELRRQLRGEIRRLQSESGRTTLFVTHDQTEALSLGGRVAVLNEGLLQQCDRPTVVYDRPANLFVARFVGSPPMNVLPAVVDGNAVRAGAITATLPSAVTQPPRGEVTLGFRPEAVSAGCPPGQGFQAVLELEEQIGHERIWHLRSDAHRLTARPQPGAAAGEGDSVHLRIDPAAVRLFDPESGKAA